MCCDLLFVILICQHVGTMVREKGRDPLPYQIFMALGWIGGEIIGGVGGAILAGILSNGNEDAIGIGAGFGVLLGLACGAGPVYLMAANLTKDPNYRPPQPAPGTSPYGPSPYGPAPQTATYNSPPLTPEQMKNPYAPPSQNPFAENPVHPQGLYGQPTPPATLSGSSSSAAAAAAAPGIPSFLPASAFAPAQPAVQNTPRRVQFYCPSGHLLEEWSTAAGQQRRCPHCGGIAAVPAV